MGPDQYPRPLGTPVPGKNGSIAGEMNGRNMKHWKTLFVAVRDHFEAIEVSITEVMYWNDYILIVLEHRDTDLPKVPCKAATIKCMYLYEDEMGRPRSYQPTTDFLTWPLEIPTIALTNFCNQD
ncbi:uncharacterized protein DNG_02713 [Cephalotrichum gorgonifer]|uniref:Uncharacterized protein n=1 Tax=Cephalotrichum gorgonifer TaxID=2041049 RepID=A0AAE8SSW9_9PEZI|nr:uncharacterized protein DNG_02713 [Cephalotrichum gorgonifer]